MHLDVAAVAAERFCGLAAAEAFGNGRSPRGGQNIRKFRFKNISQGDGAVAVQAAGHHGAVAEDAELIPHTVAAHLAAVVRGA